MANSFAALQRNFWAYITWMTPFYYKALYYFAVPTIFVVGKCLGLSNLRRHHAEAPLAAGGRGPGNDGDRGPEAADDDAWNDGASPWHVLRR